MRFSFTAIGAAERAGFAEAVVAAVRRRRSGDRAAPMSRTSAAAQRRSVSRASSGLGVGSPLGWLWTTISAVVPGVRHAGTNTSGIERACSTCPTREHVPCEKAVLRREAGDREHFDGFVASKGAKRGRGRRGLLNASVGTSDDSACRGRAADDRRRRVRGRDVRECGLSNEGASTWVSPFRGVRAAALSKACEPATAGRRSQE